MLRFHAQLGFDLRCPQLKLRNTLILHGDAVKHIGFLHSASTVSDDDKLGIVVHSAEIRGEPGDIHVIQCGLDFVQHANGAGLTFIMEK